MTMRKTKSVSFRTLTILAGSKEWVGQLISRPKTLGLSYRGKRVPAAQYAGGALIAGNYASMI